MKELILGITEQEIEMAEQELGVRFPEQLRDAWKTYNVIELRGGWRVFPIFDVRSPRKTCGNVVYENTKARWDIMPNSLTSIADNGTGNQLVLKVENGKALEPVYHWQHDTGHLRKWKPGIGSIWREAEASRGRVKALHEKFRS